MNSIETLNIQDNVVQIYGTLENPLFDAKQIIESVLQYKELNECWFYKQNKNNQVFTHVFQPTVDSPDGQINTKGLSNQYSNTTIYLTEFGLYECLFASNKPIASKFRLSVMTLLKDIRIGNLTLLVNRECETTKLLQQNKETLLSYITKNSELEQQILKLQAIVDASSEEIHIYEIEINGKFYIGSALELIRRLKQHMTKSSNPAIRRACSEGIKLKTRLLHSQKVNNRHERNHVERGIIKTRRASDRTNITIPKVRCLSKVSEECKQALEEGILKIKNNYDDLTVIDEQSVNNVQIIKQHAVDKWKQKYEQYYKFAELLKRNPEDTDKFRDEKLLAKWVYKQRFNYDNLENWQQEQLSKIEYFKPEVKMINTESFEAKLAKVVNIYKDKGSLTSANLGNLFYWYCDYSKKMKLNEICEYQRVLFNNSGIPLYITQEEQWFEYYNYCLKYYKQYKSIPVDRSVKGQFNYGRWIRRQLTENIDKLSQQQIQLLEDVGVTGKTNKNHQMYIEEFKEYMKQYKEFPKYQPGQSKDIYLYKWFRRNLQKPDVIQLVNEYSELYQIVLSTQ